MKRLPVLIFLLFCARAVSAEPVQINSGGHLKLRLTHSEYPQDSVQAFVGPATQSDQNLDGRVNFSARADSFDLEAQAELLALSGDSLNFRREAAALIPDAVRPGLPNDSRQLLDLTIELADEEDFASVLRLDRLAVRYSHDAVVMRLGRQAVSWGNSLVFQVLDPFNPFSPTEVDKDYKAGQDMAYAQYLFASGDDLQVLLVPRRDPETRSIEASQSSLAAKWHSRLEAMAVEWDLVAARHFDDNYFGFGLNREVLEAIARFDILLTEGDQRRTVSFVGNIDRSWVVAEKNVYGFVEYFRSGFGVSDGNYLPLEAALAERIERGELFTLGRDYLVLGGRLELNPLLNLYASNIFNLHDESGIFQLRSDYGLSQNVTLVAGANLPYGPSGSEFGGLESGLPGVRLSAGEVLYARADFFF